MNPPASGLWVYLSASPLTWLTVTLAAYWLADSLAARLGRHPLANTVVMAAGLIVAVLAATGTPYATYFGGAQFVHFLLGPATVALAVPLWRNLAHVRRALPAMAAALLAGSVTAASSAVAIAWAFGAPREVLASLAPKSVTSPIAMAVSERLGGLPSLTAALVMVTGILGAVASYGIVKTRFRGRTALDALTILPNAIPGVVLAVGLILAWNQPALPITPYNTWLILLMAYCCLLLPFPVRYANAALRQIGDSLEQAARVAGASSLTSFRRIVLPLILPSLLSAMLLVFAVASRELVASILVAPVGMQTIASFIWQQFEQGSVQLGMAMSAVAILITAIIPLAVMLVARRFLPGLMIEG